MNGLRSAHHPPEVQRERTRERQGGAQQAGEEGNAMSESEKAVLETMLFNRGYSDVEVVEILECIDAAEERP